MSTREADALRLRQLLAANPRDRVAWHNLAAAEGDLGRAAEAEAAARRAIALGIPAAETRLVLARALQSQRRLDEAQRAFEDAIAMRPGYLEAHRDLAQLVWMRTGDRAAALAPLERGLHAKPREAGLHHVKSIVLEFAGDLEASLAAASAGLERVPHDAALLKQAAHLHGELGQEERAVALARRSGDGVALCEALLSAGRAEEAAKVAEGLRASHPWNQYVLALLATAWRLLADARYRELYDYESFVATRRIELPRAIAEELEALHAFEAHPLQQSVRGGTQLHLQQAELDRPAIASLFRAIAQAVAAHLQQLGGGRDPLRSRNHGRFALSGAWSVRLRSGGYHADHVHPHGWLSSACYIALPPTIGAGGGDRAGWLRLGAPAIRTRPALGAEHFVKPEPGMLVLFPAYVWHGVVPFESETPRLSVAFDVVPA